MYRHKEIDDIMKNIDKIEDTAKEIQLNTYEPTLSERKNVYNEIIKYIKTKNRIVYGGYAQNELIRAKNKDDVFYREIDVADIEFYTPNPISDMIDLCDILYNKKFKHIDGKEGVHNETYKIFVNFENYCDISYLPEEIYNNCPTITLNGMRMTHPHLMLIDAYRVYCDPMNSYFRLKKTFSRFSKLINYYPFNDNMIYNKIKYDMNHDSVDKILKFIRKHIIHNSNMIVVGHYAFNQLMKLGKAPPTYMIECPFYQLISTDYNKDINMITQKLKNKYNNMNVTMKSYYPFSQFVDVSTEWYIDNELVLRVYNSYNRCIVYRKSEKKNTLFGTFQLQFLYNLIQYNMGIVRKNKFNETVYGTMLVRLLKTRDKYLDDHGISILDKSPFQEFTMKCIGETINPMRASFLDKVEKRAKGKQSTFLYKPKGSPGKKPNFHFDNTSGNIKK